MSKKESKKLRADHANDLIKAISSHGRMFFRVNDTVARIEVDDCGKVWFFDAWSGERVYTHYHGHWRNFSCGGTLKNLVCMMRDYISIGKKIPISVIAPKGICCGSDIWGYGADAKKALREDVKLMPIIELQS